jgi:hypothetical protein
MKALIALVKLIHLRLKLLHIIIDFRPCVIRIRELPQGKWIWAM